MESRATASSDDNDGSSGKTKEVIALFYRRAWQRHNLVTSKGRDSSELSDKCLYACLLGSLAKHIRLIRSG
jgi:hypothetical protein